MHFRTFAFANVVALATAHMKMANPLPFNNEKLNNSPLEATGADFPCKFGDKYDATPGGASNVYPQGSTQKLEFTGQAVHGGGSCQVSVTTDTKPTKKSVWKVIKSIQGGCPAKGQSGNLGDNAAAKDPYAYDFTIPKDLVSGNYTLAWTWFNKVGNREMYMNCAPLTVTGSGGSQGFINTLPDMFVANIGNGCQTVSDTDMRFDNPGKDVDNLGGSTMLAQKGPFVQGNCKAGSGAGDSASTPAPSAQPTSTPNSQPAVPSDQPSGTGPSLPGGVFITMTMSLSQSQSQDGSQPSQSSQSQPLPSAAPAVTSPPVAQPSAAEGNPVPANGTSGGSSSSGAFPAGSACTSDDVWNCIGGKSFQRCASGKWSVVQPVAAGTVCSPGQSNDLKMIAGKRKRFLHRAMRYVA